MLADPAEVLEPTTKKFLDDMVAAGVPPIETLSPADAREALAAAQRVPVRLPPTTIEEAKFPVGPTGALPVYIVRPQGATGPLPVVMYFHGGGWVLGDLETHGRMIRDLAHETRAAFVFVDYDRAPEAKYPTAIEQAYAATKFVAEHGRQLNLDPTRIAVAGDSAGGNMAAVVALLAQARGGPQLLFQLLYYPVTDAAMTQESYATFADGFALTTASMRWFWDAYLPDPSAGSTPTASPLRATPTQLRDLPPALIIVCENDILRDEGEAYARKLMHAGVDVTCTRYNGVIHGFAMFNALAETPQVLAAIAQGASALRTALRMNC